MPGRLKPAPTYEISRETGIDAARAALEAGDRRRTADVVGRAGRAVNQPLDEACPSQDLKLRRLRDEPEQHRDWSREQLRRGRHEDRLEGGDDAAVVIDGGAMAVVIGVVISVVVGVMIRRVVAVRLEVSMHHVPLATVGPG